MPSDGPERRATGPKNRRGRRLACLRLVREQAAEHERNRARRFGAHGGELAGEQVRKSSTKLN